MTVLMTSFSLAAIVPLNVQGIVSGTCNSSASVSVIGYCPGQVGNASCIVDNATATATGSGTYGTALTYDNAVYVTGLDVVVTATNTSCATTAIGTTTANNQVGGGPPVTINVAMTNTFTLDAPSDGASLTNQTINFSWTNNIVTPNSTIEIDDDGGFGSVDISVTDIADPNITLGTALSDGTYFWRVLTSIGSTLIQESDVFNFSLANSAPVISNISPTNTTYYSQTSIALSFSTDLAATCAYATSSGLAFTSKTVMSTTGGTSHSATVPLAGEGNNVFYLQCNSTGGVVMPADIQTTLRRDITNPSSSSASVQINGGASTATNSTINISWSGFTDSTSGIFGYYVNTSNNQGTTQGTFTNVTSLQLSSISDGVITAYVWAVDAAGNLGSSVSDAITVDTSAPTFSSWSTNPVNINMFTTSSVTIFVTVSDSSTLLGVPQLRYRIGSDAYTTAANMTIVGGSVYSFSIPNQAAPNDWANRAGENLSIVVNATDTNGYTASGSYSKFINDQFTAPVFFTINATSILQNVNTSILLGAFDADGDTLTYTSNNSDLSFVAINSSHAYAYWSPSNDDVGLNIILFNVSDGYFTASQAAIINVTNTNDAPVLSTIPALSAYEYIQFNYTINATDLDGDDLSFTVNSSLFAISSLGQIIFTPTASVRGVYSLLYTVLDSDGASDTQNGTFTVLYCGDGVCSSSYEDSDSCSLDCENDETSQGFLLNSKTCLGETMLIRAVELVPRTTCSFKGSIVNGWESCTNLSSTSFNVEQDIQGSYVAIDTLVTDEFGIVSYMPNETGDYRLRYDSTDFDENMVYFGIRECSSEETTQEVVATNDEQDEPEVNLPFFEEPLTDEQIVQLSNTTRILYFLLLPFLFVLIITAGLTTYYRYDKKKGSGTFSKDVDKIFLDVNKKLHKVSKKFTQKKWFKQVQVSFVALQEKFKGVKKTATKSIEPYVSTKYLQVPFYANQLGSLSETQLLLQSIFDYYFKSKNAENFRRALQTESLFQDKNLRIFAMNARKLGIPLHYEFSVTNDKDELLLLHEHLPVKKSYPTLTDIKSELFKGNIVAITLNMNVLNQAAPKKNFVAVLVGYNKEGYYMLDYSFSRKQKTFVPSGLLQQAWSKSGYLECIYFKK